MSELKYKVGDKVRIKSLDWYNENKDEDGYIDCGDYTFTYPMTKFCGKVVTIRYINTEFCYYVIYEDDGYRSWTDEMIEGLVEEECPQDFIEKYCKSCGTQRCDRTKEYLNGCPYYNAYLCKKQNNDMEEEALKQYEVPTGSIKIWDLPSGYIFKDERSNEIHATKIVLEKANTLKIQSDNMETETHRGYCTTEEETTNKSKKVAWFTFWDNDFADKVELDLSNRELIQEDGKWFVVKKKKEYPKTYEECLSVLGIYNGLPDVEIYNAKPSECKLFESFIRLKRCRDAYWKIAGDEMGLGKPWEPDWSTEYERKYVIEVYRNNVRTNSQGYSNTKLAFPTPEMRDSFKNNFDPDIEFCKELL